MTYLSQKPLARPRSLLPLLSLILLLAGCTDLSLHSASPSATLEQHRETTAERFTASGRFALRHENGNAAGRFSWQHGDDGDTILLSDPLGRGIAEIVRQPNSTTLTTADQRQLSAADADTLVEQALGYPLPVNGLGHWLSGRAMHPDNARRSGIDTQGRPARLTENGWLIDYRYGDGQLPRQLTAQWGDLIEIRLIIEDWQP